MEKQIDKCLISMQKIGNLNDKSRINTLNGDIDEYIEGPINKCIRMVFDSRTRALSMLTAKYAEIKEITQFIMESGKFTDRLIQIRIALDKSREGLVLYKGNTLYINDKEIKSTIEHILENKIP